MRFNAVKMPLANGRTVTIADASVTVADFHAVRALPEGWEGVPCDTCDDGIGPICYEATPESGFHRLQLFENTRYFLKADPEYEVSASGFALEEIPDPETRGRYFFTINNHLGTAWREAQDKRNALDAFLGDPFFADVGRLTSIPANNQTLMRVKRRRTMRRKTKSRKPN